MGKERKGKERKGKERKVWLSKTMNREDHESMKKRLGKSAYITHYSKEVPSS